MRRLYLQFYLWIVAILLIFLIAVGVLSRLNIINHERLDEKLALAAELAPRILQPPSATRAQQHEALEQLHSRVGLDLSVHAADGSLIAAAGERMPPPAGRPEPGWMHGPPGEAWVLHLDDGRFLMARLTGPPRRPTILLIALAGVAIAVAIGAYPVARRLTRRLERLKAGVERLGQGDLTTRVPIEGKDEVAALAASFNRSASRIEELMRAHKMLLANCSHELRTPLTRINLALSLLGDDIDPKRRAELKQDITELDELIDELLLASRLDATRAPENYESIDLLALVAEEAARDDVVVEGQSVFVRGDRTLLRRMVRNLLHNARQHATDDCPDVRVAACDGYANLTIRDHGPGIPEDEHEKIFEPFYRRPQALSSVGSGIGLALVRQIARTHGGEVKCQSAEGGGTLFKVGLPKIADAPEPVKDDEVVSAAASL
jgi:signal transduction histidine kinase